MLVVGLAFCLTSCLENETTVPGDSQYIAPPKPSTQLPSQTLPDPAGYRPTPEQQKELDERIERAAKSGCDEGIEDLYRQGLIDKGTRDKHFENKLDGWWPNEGGLRVGGQIAGAVTGDPGVDLGAALETLAGDGNADIGEDLRSVWEALKKADAWARGEENVP